MKKVIHGIRFLGAMSLVSGLTVFLTACGSVAATSSPPGLSNTGTSSTSIATTQPKSASTTTSAASIATTAQKSPSTTKIDSNLSVSAVPSVENVKPGDKFDINIRVKNNQPSRGVQFSLNWDPAKVECVSADQGGYFKDFASAHGAELFILPSDKPVADNAAGKFPKSKDPVMIALSGGRLDDGTALGATGEGDVFVLHMNVKDGASGPVDFKLANVVLGDNNNDLSQDLHASANNGKITIAP